MYRSRFSSHCSLGVADGGGFKPHFCASWTASRSDFVWSTIRRCASERTAGTDAFDNAIFPPAISKRSPEIDVINQFSSCGGGAAVAALTPTDTAAARTAQRAATLFITPVLL